MEHAPGAARPKPTEEDKAFELVRQSFLARLPGELERLARLAGELAAAGNDCAPVLRDIAMFAHRLRGTAAVFAALQISTAAQAAELAVTDVLDVGGKSNDVRVWSALRALAAALTQVIRGDGSSETPLPEAGQPTLAA